MWGNIILEVTFLTNFHLGFNNTRSDVLIHLTQWQYWWWFWFTYLWGLYFLLFMRIFRLRTLKFKPRISTSFRPHGKWGDIIVCLIPVSWCINIISNSNSILKMIEWQAESSLFTLRIRGRQWYWIYKYDLRTITDLISSPKNIGRNKWFTPTPNDLCFSDDYLHLLQLRSQNKWLERYWKEFLLKSLKENKFNVIAFNETFDEIPTEELNFKKINQNEYEDTNVNFSPNFFLKIDDIFFKNFNDLIFNDLTEFIPLKNNLNFFKKTIKNNFIELNEKNDFLMNDDLYLNKKFKYNFIKNKEIKNKIELDSYNHETFNEITRWTKRPQGSVSPIRLIKFPLNYVDNNKFITELFRFRFNDDNSKITHKPFAQNNYLVLKQKKYKPLKVVPNRVKYLRDSITGVNTKIARYSGKMILSNNNIFTHNDLESNIQYKLFKKFKKQNESLPVTLWKRLLRTKRTLVLPAHVNIAVITNSYDVVHSWFVPGLGLKLDCVPGRATHHVLHIDNVGFYYGQCAEICGRYHHHMPIRVCALPFEHFLIWWHSYGLTKLMFVRSDQKRFTKTYGLRKYTW